MARSGVSTDYSVVLPPLRRDQLEIAKSPARFKVLAAGRRWGKTRLAIIAGLAEALKGGAVLWVAPTYDKTLIAQRLMESLLAPGLPATFHRATRRLQCATSGWMQFATADAEGGLRGEGLTLTVVDEAAHIRDLQQVWEQELRPALADRQGRALFISTPRGFNYFHELFLRSRDEPDWSSWQFPTSANPRIPPEEIVSARRQLPALVFRQEYEAEFVQLAGALFQREWFSVVDSHPALTVQARHWDLAASTKTQADYSAGVRVGLDADGNAYILDCVRGRWEWPALLRVIAQTAQADGPEVLQSVETTGTQRGLLDLLLAEPALAGIAFRGVAPHTDKLARANVWLARAEQGKVKLLRGAWNAMWLDEVCAFPESEHDDQVDATSGAFAALGSHSVFLEVI